MTKIDCRAVGRTPAKIGRIVDGLSLALPVPIRLDPAERQARMAKKQQGDKLNGTSTLWRKPKEFFDIPTAIPGETPEEKFQWLWESWLDYMINRSPHEHDASIGNFLRVDSRIRKAKNDDMELLYPQNIATNEEICYLVWYMYFAYQVDRGLNRIDENCCIVIYTDPFDILADVGRAMLRIDTNVCKLLVMPIVRIEQVIKDIRRLNSRQYADDVIPDKEGYIKKDGVNSVKVAITDLRFSIKRAEQELIEFSVRAGIPIHKPGNNGGRQFYIEIDRIEQTLKVGEIKKRFTGKTWAVLMYLIDQKRQGAGTPPIVMIDGKEHKIKNVQTVLGRHFPKAASAIIEQRDGLFYLGAGAQIIGGGQVVIRGTTQRPISRNDIER